jgi:riboflavin kinase/FMN adenylyltransferase
MAEVRIYRNLEQIGGGFGPCAITVGNFDGAHIGHREIFRRVAAVAREHGWKPSAMTFDPHPATVVAPERAPHLLSTPDQRCRWMAEGGISQVVIVPFTSAFSYMSPEEFAAEVLVRRLDARSVLIGENFRFGRKKGGDAERLRQLGAKLGFMTTVVPGIQFRGRTVSSSEIRRLLAAGNVSLAGRLLGRPYSLEGEVVRGTGTGSRLTVPTLNLVPGEEILLPHGVYVTRTRDLESGSCWPSVTNVGVRPTFGGDRLTVETFLLSPLSGAPPRWIAVEFLRRLRPERKFPDPQSLKAQILRDSERAQACHRRFDRWLNRGV